MGNTLDKRYGQFNKQRAPDRGTGPGDSRVIIPTYIKSLIRTAYIQDNKINQSEIARLFGVSRQRIGQIMHGEKYKYLEVDTLIRITLADLKQAKINMKENK